MSVVGLTLSTEQKAWADARIAEASLADRIDIRLQDYREIDERFDAIASVEMVEAVGQRYWPAYLDCLARNLKPGGKAALQFISIDHRLFDRYAGSADFIQAYIFPGGMLIDEPRFEALAKERGLSWEDRDGFGLDYAETLRIWRARYDAAVAARPARRLRRRVPRSVALLSDVLRRRLPRRRDRRRAGDAVEVDPSRGDGVQSIRLRLPVSASPSNRSTIARATTSGVLSVDGSSPGKAFWRIRVRVAPGSISWTRSLPAWAVSSA